MSTATFENCLNYFNIFNKIVGVSVVNYSLENGKVKTEFNICCCLNFFVIIICLPITSVIIACSTSQKSLDIIYEGWKITGIYSCITCCLQSIIQIVQFNKTTKIFQLLKDSEDKSLELGERKSKYKIDHTSEQKTIIYSIILSILSILYCLAFLIITFDYHNPLETSQSYCFSVTLIMNTHFSLQFFLLIFMIKLRFKLLNHILIDTLSIKSAKLKITRLHKFINDFYILSKLVKIFNKSFTLTMSFTVINILVNGVLSLYSIIKWMFLKVHVDEFDLITTHIWAFLHVAFSILVCYSGSSLEKEAYLSEKHVLNSLKRYRQHEKLECELKEIHQTLMGLDNRIQNVFGTFDFKLLVVVSDKT